MLSLMLIGAALVAPLARADTIEFLPLGASMLHDCIGQPPVAADSIPCRARRQFDAGQLEARLHDAHAAWLDGTQLVFAVRTGQGPVSLMGGIQLPMAHLPGTDLWVLSVHVPRADHAVIGYRFSSDPREADTREWRGSLAPLRPSEAVHLRGTVRQDTIPSTTMGERRALVTYLPPGWSRAARHPVIFAADGQAVSALAPLIDTLVSSGTIPPVAVVGVVSPPFVMGKPPVRALEYVLGASPDSSRFLAHEEFFLREVIPWASRTIGADTVRARRAVMGISDGGAFAMTIALRNPAIFGSVIALSPAGRTPVVAGAAALPRFYVSAGSLEPPIRRVALGAQRALTARGAVVQFADRVSAHEDVAWTSELPAALRWLLRSP